MQKQPIEGADLKEVDVGGGVVVCKCACAHMHVCLCLVVEFGGVGVDCNNVFFRCSGEQAGT